MRNKKIVLVCAGFIAIASYYYSRTINNETQNQDNNLVTSVDKKIVHSPTQKNITNNPPREFPRFVAGRPALVKKSQEIYKDRPIDKNNEEKFIGEKIKITSIGQSPPLRLSSVGISFATDLYGCSELECSKENAVLTANGFFIYKGVIPNSLNSKSKSLVTFNENTYQYGIWERRVIFETKGSDAFRQVLLDNHFEAIEQVQKKVYIAEYVGEVTNLDSVLSEFKQNPEVVNLRLEISYSRSRTN